MKKIIISLLVASCGLIACTDTQDDYYSSSEPLVSVDPTVTVLDCTLTEFFESNGDKFSKFYELLKETNIVENNLESGQDFTVWAVKDSAFEEPLTEEGILDTARVRYHVNYLAIDKSQLTNGKRLKTISGVYIAITNDESGFFANESEILETYRLKNGVVYIIDKLMVPQLNLYDYIAQLPDDYSIFRHAVIDSSYPKFDKSKSTPIGVDATGNTVYDSVKVIDNPLFNTVKINAEDQQFTCFLPSNAVLNSCFARLRETYEGIGRVFTEADSLSALLWIKQAAFYSGLLLPAQASEADVYSAFNKQWRNIDQKGNPVQRINTEYEKLSNAYVYTVDSMKVPMNVIISRLKQYFYHLKSVLSDDYATQRKLYFFGKGVKSGSPSVAVDAELPDPVLNAGWPSPAWAEYGTVPGVDLFTEFEKKGGKYAYTYVNIYGSDDPGEFSASMTPLRPTALAYGAPAEPYMIPAGEYTLHMGVRSKASGMAKVFFGTCELDEDGNMQLADNGDVKLIVDQTYPDEKLRTDAKGYQLVQTNVNFEASNPWNFDRAGSGGQPEYAQRNGRKWNSDGGEVGKVLVRGEGMQIVRIKLEYVAGEKRFQPYHWCLIPSENNY